MLIIWGREYHHRLKLDRETSRKLRKVFSSAFLRKAQKKTRKNKAQESVWLWVFLSK